MLSKMFGKRWVTAGLAGVLLVGVALIFSACNTTHSAQVTRNLSSQIQNQYQTAQPAPQFKWSQLRQDLISVQQAQAGGAETTTFFYNLGVTSPVQTCPSLGFPIASTSELTSPQRVARTTHNVVLPNLTPTGIYVGDSSGTYVVCVNPDGKPYIDYWEGYVQAVAGPAVWDTATHSVRMTGTSSVPIKIGKNG